VAFAPVRTDRLVGFFLKLNNDVDEPQLFYEENKFYYYFFFTNECINPIFKNGQKTTENRCILREKGRKWQLIREETKRKKCALKRKTCKG
jgi:hypothetical protein